MKITIKYFRGSPAWSRFGYCPYDFGNDSITKAYRNGLSRRLEHDPAFPKSQAFLRLTRSRGDTK